MSEAGLCAPKRYFYLCNVFEESVKVRRSITTDSPAANAKVARLCHAVRTAGGDVRIISLGRGRALGTLRRYRASRGEFGSVPITYLAHWDIPVLTHLVTMVSLAATVLRVTQRGSVLVFYNCQVHYLLALLAGRLLGRSCVLDIEDGYRSDDTSLRALPSKTVLKIFNACCNGGTMLACSALRAQTPAARSYVCYGVAVGSPGAKDWSAAPLKVLLGGSLLVDTGALLFLEALALIQAEHPGALRRLSFVVTGFGALAGALQDASRGAMKEFLSFRGNVTAEEYREIMQECQVGLCLKLPASSMGATTFPSKVVELAANGLLVVATRVSDVPLLFDETTALLLDAATARALAESLLQVAEHPELAQEIALKGQHDIVRRLSEAKVGAELLRFWQGEP
jgi:hypothetical protein